MPMPSRPAFLFEKGEAGRNAQKRTLLLRGLKRSI